MHYIQVFSIETDMAGIFQKGLFVNSKFKIQIHFQYSNIQKAKLSEIRYLTNIDKYREAALKKYYRIFSPK